MAQSEDASLALPVFPKVSPEIEDLGRTALMILRLCGGPQVEQGIRAKENELTAISHRHHTGSYV